MHRHFESIEADWARYYNRDLAQDLYGHPSISWRYINSLLTWLPSDAAVWRSMGNAWSDEKELAATNIEVVDALRRAFIVANSKKGAREPEPVRIPRPWQKSEAVKRKGTSLGEMMRVMKMPLKKEEVS